MNDIIDRFNKEREIANKNILDKGDINIKRFFGLDTKVYKDGALSAKTKEMLGLSSSLVLRCDDCIKYHIIQCYNEGVTTAEIMEVFSIGLIVGGSITIPHIRRGMDIWDKINSD